MISVFWECSARLQGRTGSGYEPRNPWVMGNRHPLAEDGDQQCTGDEIPGRTSTSIGLLPSRRASTVMNRELKIPTLAIRRPEMATALG